MDEVTFRMDTVLSDVHLLLPNARHLMTRLNGVGQPVFISKFKILWDAEEKEPACGGLSEDGSPSSASEAPLDDDGDLDVARRPRDASPERERVCPIILRQATGTSTDGRGEDDDDEEEEEEATRQDVIRIEHTMATPLEDVGKQIWRGAFLLADFILSRPAEFEGVTVLELGAGTGLTSVVMATQAKMVYCTDVGQDLLSMCQRNVTINRHLTEAKASEVRVRQLDWTGDDFCTDAEVAYAWTEDEVADLHNETSLIMAADVCYDDELTDALFRMLYRITSNLRNQSTVYLSIEKRLNFTLRHMEVSCEAYDHFRHCLDELHDMEDGKMQYCVEQVLSPFPQFFQYERVEHLELWKVSAYQK
ncbi:methyltransferase-like protein 22 [Clupea harengus]|uniref:Methyltransferase-like protein 22 n=1 Tax=Clupea harengus TaxID=7950 RepID=A0A6P3VW51_CLUHA|nr:methyltransferase-like protein 22 [Clupea harengus]XP_012682607.2 methyltransferase-like protein 22 [Clupea harengus]